MSEIIEKARAFLRGRQGSYRAAFNSPAGQDVLVDLAKFCRAHASTAHTDPHMAARLDGRREVWLRIQSHLRLSDDELWRLFNPPMR